MPRLEPSQMTVLEGQSASTMDFVIMVAAMAWCAISDLYNWIQKDPILDWLDRYGSAAGIVPDNERPLYIEEADYGVFVRDIANRFEAKVLELIRGRVDIAVITGAQSNSDQFFEQTKRLMGESQEAIYQGLVRDYDLEVFGVPDLIIRGSAMDRLVPGTLGELDPSAYYVLDVKFKGLELNKRGDLKSTHGWERTQLALYERALASMQKRSPTRAFVLGRRLAGEEGSGGGCLDVLPWVGQLDDKGLTTVSDGLAWRQDLDEYGATWTLDPPTDPRLEPNPRNVQDSPWHETKKLLLEKRERAPWAGDPVQPKVIQAGRTAWLVPRELEFFVDFETFNAMNDDFSALPQARGTPMIFMIGCGHVENGQWQFRVWTAEQETYAAEAAMIESWMAHMAETRSRLAPNLSRPLVYHWHSHEVKELEKAAARHARSDWLDLNWYDLLWQVFKAEPVRIEGIDSHSLKPVTRKLHELGHIDTVWAESPVADGLAAMAAAWACYAAATKSGRSVHEAAYVDGRSLMGDIEAYNQVDCKAMWEILSYLRTNH